jgi:predicted enzyme related to lactoylglutathione lyase
MEKVNEIGGVFIRAKDPTALAAWYRDMLGINLAPSDMETPAWVSEGGVTVFAPFAADTDYFPKTQQAMINFRVSDLDAMLAQLRAVGVEPFNETEMEGIGRFAHIADPEGNALELWEPAG